MLGYSPWLVDWSVFGESQLIPVLCFAEALVDSRLLAGYLLGYSFWLVLWSVFDLESNHSGALSDAHCLQSRSWMCAWVSSVGWWSGIHCFGIHLMVCLVVLT